MLNLTLDPAVQVHLMKTYRIGFPEFIARWKISCSWVEARVNARWRTGDATPGPLEAAAMMHLMLGLTPDHQHRQRAMLSVGATRILAAFKK